MQLSKDFFSSQLFNSIIYITTSHYNELNLIYIIIIIIWGGGGNFHYRGCFRLRGLLKHSVAFHPQIFTGDLLQFYGILKKKYFFSKEKRFPKIAVLLSQHS